VYRPKPEVCHDLEQGLRQEQVVLVRDASRALPDARLEREQSRRSLERKGRPSRYGPKSPTVSENVDLFRVENRKTN